MAGGLTNVRIHHTISASDITPHVIDREWQRKEATMTNDHSDPETFLPLTPAKFHILLALARGEQHGYAIMLDVEQQTEGRFTLGPGTLYGAIKRLLEE